MEEKEKITITKTELRALMFWASSGIMKSHGGSYMSAKDFIREHYQLMNHNKKKYKNLDFGQMIKTSK